MLSGSHLPERDKWTYLILSGLVFPLVVGVILIVLSSRCERPSAPEEASQPSRVGGVPDQRPKAISVEEAARAVGKLCTIEFQVKSGRPAKNKPLVFLNSEANYQHPKNFSVMITEDVLTGLKKQGITAEHYYIGKTIRVTGIVKTYKDRPEIVVVSADQIQPVVR